MDDELKYPPERIAEYKQIRAYLRCKSTMYQYLRFRQQAVLLNYPTIDMKFIMQLITGVKKFITRDKLIQSRSKPRFALDKRQLYRLCNKHPVISQYLPNRRNQCKTELMCKLAQVLDPEMYTREILSAKGLVAKRDKEKIKQKLPKTISVTPEFANILLKMPVASNGEEESLSTRRNKSDDHCDKRPKVAEELNIDQDQDKKE
jgi:hypothetical protein